MTTILNNAFAINGVISTDRTVLQNINTLCSASNAWMTYDISEGLWAVVINEPSTVQATFNDANIIGGINVSGSGIGELYNSATIEFPHRDIRDQRDYKDIEIPLNQRFPNELDNRLNISLNCINNPVQAQYIASVELKQSRADKVIEFRSDYNIVGLKAGDIIAVTNEVYGYTNKAFRIVKLEENDDDLFSISITAIEYDADVYDASDLVFTQREKKTGIVPKSANTALTANDNAANGLSTANGLNGLLTATAIAALLSSGIGPLFEYLKTTSDSAKAGATAENPGATIPTYATTFVNVPAATVLGQFNAFSGALQPADSAFVGDPGAFVEVFFTVPNNFDTLQFFVKNPLASYIMFDQTIGFNTLSNVPAVTSIIKTQFPELSAPVVTDVQITLIPSVVVSVFQEAFPIDVEANIPMVCGVFYNGQGLDIEFTGTTTESSVFTITNAPAGEYTLRFTPSTVLGTFSGRNVHGYYNPLPGLEILSDILVQVLAFKN
jgi:hypothetical protein